MLIKIPATAEGLPAITAATAAGISVNVTLIFGLDRYDAGHGRLPDRARAGARRRASTCRRSARSPRSSSPASTPRSTSGWTRSAPTRPQALRGKAGIANARLAYERYEKVFASDRWKALEAAGANTQRPLWASTGVKDPSYDDTMYVVDLVAPNTVNTMPEATLDAVADHGHDRAATRSPAPTTTPARSSTTWRRSASATTTSSRVLEVEGVQKFEDSYAQLAESVQGQLDDAGR